MGVPDMIDARQQRPPGAAVGADAADRNPAETDAVVAALPADQAGARRPWPIDFW